MFGENKKTAAACPTDAFEHILEYSRVKLDTIRPKQNMFVQHLLEILYFQLNSLEPLKLL